MGMNIEQMRELKKAPARQRDVYEVVVDGIPKGYITYDMLEEVNSFLKNEYFGSKIEYYLYLFTGEILGQNDHKYEVVPDEKIEAKIPGGVVRAYKDTDPDRPGICIMYEPDNLGSAIDLVNVESRTENAEKEGDGKEGDLYVYLWGDVNDEDYTYKTVITATDVKEMVNIYAPMLSMTVYCDSTDLYTEEEIKSENLTQLDFPEEIVKEWYEKHKNEYDANSVGNFNDFLNSYTADDTDGLYEYAKSHGFQAKRWEPKEVAV